ncbi:MAG: hypothetical protein A3J84_04555 [Ignavibacteria bacterium RIFOXYA2_FULL_37_17]|nr:MAG: hypothetical protein A3J84_04555 [Ignavibacteria bacterium RIFOXYA2_FULL_37_17]
MAAHFEKRNTKFGGGKIGIGKRGRAKIPCLPPACPAYRQAGGRQVVPTKLAHRQLIQVINSFK